MANLYRVTVDGIVPKGESNPECIPFSAGNPRVEHVVGALHLYRPLADVGKSLEADRANEDAVANSATDQVCVLAVPGDMGFKDFCQFLGSYVSGICKMWMVRREDTPSKTVCMALLQFKMVDDAASFVQDYNGKPFSVLEPDVICRCVAVSHVEMSTDPGTPVAPPLSAPSTSASAPLTPTAPPVGHVELPTCPVCLERLDEHISGIITTVCNHKFHNECLQKWGDASCPVCRYCMHNNSTSKCDVCEASVDLWICLICGHVGCGRYKESHALLHFQQSHHCYSLELESGRVWDYVGDGYVHRLIQSNADGKLVEVPSPGPAQSMVRSGQSNAVAGSSTTCKRGQGDDRPYSASPTLPEGNAALDELHMIEAMYESKMDAVSREYSHLLTSQLESQRQYFEELRVQDALEHNRVVQALEQKLLEQEAQVHKATMRAHEWEGNSKNMQKRLKELEQKLKEAKKDGDMFTELNKQLIANQAVFKEKAALAEEQSCLKDATITDLKEQVRDMMVYIEAGQIASAEGNELAGGSAQVAPAQGKRSARKSKR